MIQNFEVRANASIADEAVDSEVRVGVAASSKFICSVVCRTKSRRPMNNRYLRAIQRQERRT